ncbi:hypothetical protein P2A14_08125, partial [Xanthomonas perforans]
MLAVGLRIAWPAMCLACFRMLVSTAARPLFGPWRTGNSLAQPAAHCEWRLALPGQTTDSTRAAQGR